MQVQSNIIFVYWGRSTPPPTLVRRCRVIATLSLCLTLLMLSTLRYDN